MDLKAVRSGAIHGMPERFSRIAPMTALLFTFLAICILSVARSESMSFLTSCVTLESCQHILDVPENCFDSPARVVRALHLHGHSSLASTSEGRVEDSIALVRNLGVFSFLSDYACFSTLFHEDAPLDGDPCTDPSERVEPARMTSPLSPRIWRAS